MSRRHSPRADLGVGTALLVGGIGFLLVSLFSGWDSAWAFAGGVAAMTGAGKAYRGGRELYTRRVQHRGLKPVPVRGRWSQALPWASELWEKPEKKPKAKAKQKQQQAAQPACSAACLNSTQPRSTCECPCGGTRHGSAVNRNGSNGHRGGTRSQAARPAGNGTTRRPAGRR